jgi:hypothetical protein
LNSLKLPTEIEATNILLSVAGVNSNNSSRNPSEPVKIEFAADGRPAPVALPSDCCRAAVTHSVAGRIQTAEIGPNWSVFHTQNSPGYQLQPRNGSVSISIKFVLIRQD